MYPHVEVKMAFITTSYPRASPIEVDKLITISIENALRDIDEIDKF
jgi:multidrug efflux pump subunit AcrB